MIMEFIFSFFAHHPFFGAAIAALFLGILVVAELLIVLPIMGRVIRRAMPSLGRAQTEASHPVWPALVYETRSSWERMLFWSGFHDKIPPARKIIFGFFALTIVLVFAIGSFGFIVTVVLVGLAYLWIRMRAGKAQDLFSAQLPDGLQSLVDTLRAGYTLPQAIVFLSRETMPPMQLVFRALERAQTLQITFADALARTAAQMGVREWSVVAETLSAQQRLGGNVIPFLEETAKSVRDRMSVEQEIKSMTAAGRMSGFLIAGLVPIVLIVFSLLSPSYVSVLFTTPLGRTLLMICAGLELVGFFWIRKIVSIDY